MIQLNLIFGLSVRVAHIEHDEITPFDEVLELDLTLSAMTI
jgi:hypothetical protein